MKDFLFEKFGSFSSHHGHQYKAHDFGTEGQIQNAIRDDLSLRLRVATQGRNNVIGNWNGSGMFGKRDEDITTRKRFND